MKMSWVPSGLFRRKGKGTCATGTAHAAAAHTAPPTMGADGHGHSNGHAAASPARALQRGATASRSSLGSYGFGDEHDWDGGGDELDHRGHTYRRSSNSNCTIFGFVDENDHDITPVGFDLDTAHCSVLLEALDEMSVTSRLGSLSTAPPAYESGGYMSLEKGHCLTYFGWSKADYDAWDA